MARLNEAPQPSGESIDALKRRFVRQNREIAKANSTQSLRIRTLEAEISRLLAENVSLREQIIHLHEELEDIRHEQQRGASHQTDPQALDIVRARLEVKIREFGDLVQEISQVQRAAEERGGDWRRRRRKSHGVTRDSLGSRSGSKKSPRNAREWRNALGLMGEIPEEEDEGRLPVILEDKFYPRQTLDADEIRNILTDPANVTDSPDLGPPPIAHFDDQETAQDDNEGQRRRNQRNRDETALLDDEGDFAAAGISVNLETRKKRRRESMHQQREDFKAQDPTKSDPKAAATAAESTNNDKSGVKQNYKSGAKRKLEVREKEDEETSTGGAIVEKSDLPFNRKRGDKSTTTASLQPDSEKASIGRVRAGENKISDRKATPGDQRRAKEGPEEKVVPVAAGGRRALGPKSTNVDPASPIKTRAVSVKDDSIEAAKKESGNGNGNSTRDSIRERLNRSSDAKPTSRGTSRSQPPSIAKFKPSTTNPPLLTLPTSTLTSTNAESMNTNTTNTTSMEDPPETPSSPPLDLFSPPADPSPDPFPTATTGGRGDTPPPPDIDRRNHNGSIVNNSSFGRASRRSRGTAVSYAEPNLRDKMRRPGKELVDAVVVAASAVSAAKSGTKGTMGRDDDLAIEGEGEGRSKERERANTTSPLGKKTAETVAAQVAAAVTFEVEDAADEERGGIVELAHASRRRGSTATKGSVTSRMKDEEGKRAQLDSEDKQHNHDSTDRKTSGSNGTIAALITTTSNLKTRTEKDSAPQGGPGLKKNQSRKSSAVENATTTSADAVVRGDSIFDFTGSPSLLSSSSHFSSSSSPASTGADGSSNSNQHHRRNSSAGGGSGGGGGGGSHLLALGKDKSSLQRSSSSSISSSQRRRHSTAVAAAPTSNTTSSTSSRRRPTTSLKIHEDDSNSGSGTATADAVGLLLAPEEGAGRRSVKVSKNNVSLNDKTRRVVDKDIDIDNDDEDGGANEPTPDAAAVASTTLTGSRAAGRRRSMML